MKFELKDISRAQNIWLYCVFFRHKFSSTDRVGFYFRTERNMFKRGKSFLNRKENLRVYMFLNIILTKQKIGTWDKNTNKPRISYYKI